MKTRPQFRFILCLMLFIISDGLLAQTPDTAWTQNYHRGSWEAVYSIQQTSDDGFIMAGPSHLLNDNIDEIFLLKADQNGDSLWSKVIGNNQGFYPNCVQEDLNGDYVIAGEKQNVSGPRSAFMLKTNENGDSLWTLFFGGSGNTIANHVTCTSDGGYAFTGYRYISTNQSMYLCKSDANGDSSWFKTFDRGGDEIGTCINQTSDGGFIIGGETDYHTAGRTDFYLIKTDSLGDTLWTRTYGDNRDDHCYSVQQTTDGGYILFGTSDSTGANTVTRSLAIKTDAAGVVVWQKIFNRGTGGDFGHSVQQTSDGGYIFGSNSLNPGQSQDFCFIRTDADGNIQWIKTVGGSATERAYSVLQTSDGGYVLAGETAYLLPRGGDFWVVKLNASPTVIKEKKYISSTLQLMQNHPNPFNPTTTINYQLPMTNHVELKVYDVLGREISTLVDRQLPAGSYEVQWNARNLPSGIYYYQLQAGDYQEVKKMILMK